MVYLAYLVVSFAVLQLLVALSNWLFIQKMPLSEEEFGLVSVLIPARNEEDNISKLLSDLQAQSYQNIEILIFNDQSEDDTHTVVNKFAAQDSRIRLIESDGLPEGWLGKNNACHSLSLQAKGDYFLFLDADVRIGKHLISRTVQFSKTNQLGLLSIFPKQLMLTRGEQLTVPMMNVILLSLLPLVLVQKSKRPSISAANGQFMLFDAAIYREQLPHSKFRSEKVEDIATARHFKENHLSVACLLGDEELTCRMYSSYDEAINGFSKNVLSFFGNSAMASILFWLVTTMGIIPVFTVFSPKIVALYLLFVILTRIVIAVASKQSVLQSCIFWLGQQMAMGEMIFQAIRNKSNKQLLWKGRNIS
ncbi:MAG: glycosyltransferase [Bacteroidales bacterium]